MGRVSPGLEEPEPEPANTNPDNRDAHLPAAIGRHSPPTYVRAVENSTYSGSSTPTPPPPPTGEISREYNVPIRLTHQPAVPAAGPRVPIISTVVSPPSSLQHYPNPEREPFLPPRSLDTSPTNFESSIGRPKSASPSGPQLTLIRTMPEYEVDPPVGFRAKLSKWTYIGNQLVREGLAEFLGSFILIIFGNGAVAEVVLSTKPGKPGVNDFFSINIAYGLAVAFGIYVAGGVSGGHLNPAVTLAMACLGKLKWRKVPVFFLAQYLGCFVASAVLHAVYADALFAKDGGIRITDPLHENATAGIFASYPQSYLTWGGGLLDQIFVTSFFLIGIMALVDERNMGPHKGVVPLLIGLLITVIGLSYGYNCGYPVNPARDLGPRIYTAIAGWGLDPFTVAGNTYSWWWIPVVGPHLGALLGVAVYQLFIGNQWPVSQRTGIELQVVRKGGANDEYELVKSSNIRSGDITVPVSLLTKDGASQRLLER